MQDLNKAPRANNVIAVFGKGVVRGFVIGRAMVINSGTPEIAHYRLEENEITAECQRLDKALSDVYDELQDLLKNLPADAPKEMGPLLTVHSLIVKDPVLASKTKEIIQQKRYNAEWALTAYEEELNHQFAAMDDEYMSERISDIHQVIERVLVALSDTEPVEEVLPMPMEQGTLDQNVTIVVAHDISPADMLKLRGARFSAFATDLGGATSHTAIVARSMNVPAIVGMGNILEVVAENDMLVVDGEMGVVIVNPSQTILNHYRQKQEAFLREREQLIAQKTSPAITLDGHKVKLMANIELPHEVDMALEMGAEGIGLFRTEFLFMGRGDALPDENEQFEAYAYVLQKMRHRPVTIRTLDLGQDKNLDGVQHTEANPALGLRAVRYCLAHPEIFMPQLRALLRASVYGRLRILIPMLAHMSEIYAVQQALGFVRDQLKEEGVAVNPNIELGAMVEIPAIALAIRSFLAHLDFVSIGTNDLIQYTLAIDRCDNAVAHLYEPLHPGVLNLIQMTIAAGNGMGKSVSICGEMAGEAKYTRLLLGMGLKEFSMHPLTLPEIRHIIRHSDTRELKERLQGALEQSHSLDLKELGL